MHMRVVLFIEVRTEIYSICENYYFITSKLYSKLFLRGKNRTWVDLLYLRKCKIIRPSKCHTSHSIYLVFHEDVNKGELIAG